ncbi:MAG: hypothetical protein WCV90_06475 [Candidatus Woesearchaeota archaeon]
MEKKTINPEIGAYIRDNLRLGRRYSHITQKLMEAGWLKEEINQAYHEVLGGNSVQQPKVRNTYSSNRQPPNIQRNKVLVIVGVSILLVIGVLLLLNGTIGNAIYFDKLIGGSKNATSGEVTYTVQCTPPHILNPEQNGCCLDENQNGKCDQEDKEAVVNQTDLTRPCLDHRQCGQLKCINGKCSDLTGLYQRPLSSCTKVCNFYNVDVLTSDNELYSVKPGEGSYTGAGALDWTILSAPDHCVEEPAIIPIEISRRKTGMTLNTEIITLGLVQTSKAMTHPYVPQLSFTLTVRDIYELCAPSQGELQFLLQKQKALETALKAKK